MILAHRIQLDPTSKQAIYFAKACGTARLVWNWALAEWKEQYEAGGKPKASELKRLFNADKYKKYPWMADIHRDAHSQPFANLQQTFQRFFKGTSKYPRFKKKGKSRDSFYVANDKITVIEQKVRLPVIGCIRMTEPLRFIGKIVFSIVSREADRWFISINVEMPESEVASPKDDAVGVDLGLTTFATLSTGEKIIAPKPLARAQRKLRRLGRLHSRCVQGSNNRRKASLRLARCHRKVRNVRKDFIHKFTTRLSKNHREICIEDLNVSGMMKNHCLARAISDAGWGEAHRQLDYKTRLYGSELTVRDRFFASSKICSDCGYKVEALLLSIREWVCPSCGVIHNRDENAAKNLTKSYTEDSSGIYASGDQSSDILTDVQLRSMKEELQR